MNIEMLALLDPHNPSFKIYAGYTIESPMIGSSSSRSMLHDGKPIPNINAQSVLKNNTLFVFISFHLKCECSSNSPRTPRHGVILDDLILGIRQVDDFRL